MPVIKKINFSGSLYTFLEFIQGLARPPCPYHFSRIQPLIRYTFLYKGDSLLLALPRVCHSTSGAYSIILYCLNQCLYYTTQDSACQYLFQNFLKIFHKACYYPATRTSYGYWLLTQTFNRGFCQPLVGSAFFYN